MLKLGLKLCKTTAWMRLIAITSLVRKMYNHLHLKILMKKKQRRGYEVAKSFVKVSRLNTDNLPTVMVKKYIQLTKDVGSADEYDASDSHQEEQGYPRAILQLNCAGRGASSTSFQRYFGL